MGGLQHSGPDGSNPAGPAAAMLGRPSIPVMPDVSAPLTPNRLRLVWRFADDLLADDPRLAATEPFGPNVSAGLGPWPALVMEDHSAIEPYDLSEDIAYSYRALLLAGQGDLLAIGVPRNVAFEGYCRDCLNLGAVDVVVPQPAPGTASLAIRCAEDPAFVAGVAARARSAGGMNVIPYMGSGAVWRMAGRISDRAGVPVKVAAPSPRLTARVNDKLWFAALVRGILGEHALPVALPAYSLSGLTGTVRSLAKANACVAVKLTDSASASGNLILTAAELLTVRATVLRDRLTALLRRAGWRGRFPLMVTAWERPVVASPSVQLWVPGPETGGPLVEGIFDQVLVSPAGRFAGATPTGLPGALQDRLCAEASRIAGVLQAVGYFGRCSFDAILVGERADSAKIHWVECNGRWGGVSLPMTLANRLVGDWRKRPFVIVDHSGSEARPRTLDAVLDLLGDDLFVAGKTTAGAVVISPGQIQAGTGFELMVIGNSLADAQARAETVTAKLLR